MALRKVRLFNSRHINRFMAHPLDVDTLMISRPRNPFCKALPVILIASLTLPLSGCIVAIPTAFKFISIAADGISLISTGKTTTDHAISEIAGQDCSMSRALKSEDVCKQELADVPLDPQTPQALDTPKQYP